MQGKDDVAKKERYEELMLKGSTAYRSLIKDDKKPYVYSKAVTEDEKNASSGIGAECKRNTGDI